MYNSYYTFSSVCEGGLAGVSPACKDRFLGGIPVGSGLYRVGAGCV